MEEVKDNLKLSVQTLCKVLHCFDFFWLFALFSFWYVELCQRYTAAEKLTVQGKKWK